MGGAPIRLLEFDRFISAFSPEPAHTDRGRTATTPSVTLGLLPLLLGLLPLLVGLLPLLLGLLPLLLGLVMLLLWLVRLRVWVEVEEEADGTAGEDGTDTDGVAGRELVVVLTWCAEFLALSVPSSSSLGACSLTPRQRVKVNVEPWMERGREGGRSQRGRRGGEGGGEKVRRGTVAESC